MRLVFHLATLGIAALLAGGVWQLVLAPAVRWKKEALAARDQAAEKLAQFEQRVQKMDTLRQQLSQQGELASLWQADQPGAATALVQSELSKLASQRGIGLRSITPMREREIPMARAAGFRLEIETSLDQLAGFLQAVEYHSPALMVDRASLRRLNMVNAGQVQPVVFAQIEISAPISIPEEADQ